VLKDAQDVLKLIASKLFDQGGLEIGPIPAGTPIDLLANFDPLPQSTNFRERLAHDKAVVKAVVQLVRDLKALPPNATDEQARQVFSNLGEQLLALIHCPDSVGH